MLNEFAGIRKVSDESLGRDETPRYTSHEILNSSQVFDNFLLYIIREHAVGNPSVIEGQTANIFRERDIERDAQRVCWNLKSI